MNVNSNPLILKSQKIVVTWTVYDWEVLLLTFDLNFVEKMSLSSSSGEVSDLEVVRKNSK